MYLADTDIVAEFLKGIPRTVDLLTRRAADGIAISIVTYGEVLEGVYFGRNPRGDEAAFSRFLASVAIVPLDQPIMQRFARIRGTLRRQGLLIDAPDVMIAATAIEADLILVTRNRRHFDRVPGLRMLDEP